jgi:mannan endo-1,4-beta-mannosidase
MHFRSSAVAQMASAAVWLAACGDGAEPATQSGSPNLPDLGSMDPDQASPTLPGDGAGGQPGSTDTPGQGGTEGMNPSLPLASGGVVVGDVGAGTAQCVPLCTVNTDPTQDPEGDEWSSENGASCIIPGTITARANQECTTGAPLPPPRQVPGVVVVDQNVPRCAPLCRIVTSLADDPDGDGWFYENNLSCVVPGTPTALANQPCTTGGALPESEPRPGVLIADGLGSACRPVCQVVTTPSSPNAPDWGYEQNDSCVLPASATFAASARSCTFGGPSAPLLPPPLAGAKVAAGFFVQDGRLRDAYGGDFVIRGVNNPHYWFDTGAQYQAYLALDTIASYGTNTIRVVWETGGPPALLREVLHRIVELEMVPMVELHDVTSDTGRARLVDMAEYYASADVKQVLIDFREYLLVNIANEWSGNDFVGAYTEAVTYLRSNGVSHTLVIDANGFGQNGQVIIDNAAALESADPERNLLFSVHMYERFGTNAAVDNFLNAATSRSIPVIVGEFGWEHNEQPVAWERILTRSDELGVGYLAWSWLGNDEQTAHLDMAVSPAGPLTDWGSDVMTAAPGSIQQTSQRASIFD